MADPDPRELKKLVARLYKAYVKGKSNEVVLMLGEWDSPDTDSQNDALDYLKSKKVITYRIQKGQRHVADVGSPEDEEEATEKITMEEAVCKISIDRLTKLAQEMSVVPEFYLRRLPTREIILNDKYRLSKPDFTSENDRVFEYLYERANKPVSIRELRDKAGGIKKPVHQIVRDLKFKNGLQLVFFPNMSREAVLFRKSLLKKDSDRLGLDRKKLNSYLSKLPKWKRNSEK